MNTTTSCDGYRERFVLWADGEPTAGDPLDLARHLADCPACLTFCADLRTLRGELSASPVPPLSQAWREHLLEQVELEVAKGQRAAFSLRTGPAFSWSSVAALRWVGAVAVALLLLSSWALCFHLNRKIAALRRNTGVPSQIAAQQQKVNHIEQAQDRQQSAIVILHDRMGELERRIVRRASPHRVYFPDSPYIERGTAGERYYENTSNNNRRSSPKETEL